MTTPSSTPAEPPVARIWLTVREASALSTLSPFVIRAHIATGKLKAFSPSPRGTKVALDSLAPFLPPEIRSMLPRSLAGADTRVSLARILRDVLINPERQPPAPLNLTPTEPASTQEQA